MNSEFDLILELSESSPTYSTVDISSMSQKKLIKLLIDNQVLLPFLKNSEHFSNPEFLNLRNNIKEILKKDYLVNPEKKFLIAFSIFDELKIEFMLHKHIFYDREQGDIDILVHENDFKFVIDELEKQGFSITSSESFKLGMTKFEHDEKFTIHVHAKIKWESEFISTDDVWKRSRKISLFNQMTIVPSPEDSVLIECAHASFEARLLRLCDLLQFLELLKHDSINWDKVVSRLIQYGYHSAGYLYFLAMNHLANKLFNINPIPKMVLDSLEQKINSFEKTFAINNAKKLILSNNEKIAPLRISLFSSALLFISFNKNLGTKKFIWSLGVITSATIRFIQVKLRLRKL
jgi:hypothetical protein